MCAKLAHMGDMDEKVLGNRVRESRERAGLSQGELATLIGVERTVVNKIENGLRRVTALELSDIASELKVRMATFFEEPVPALISHRSSQGLDTTDSSIDHLLARIAEDVEFIHELAPTALALPDEVETPLARPQSMAEADAMAHHVRTRLGLDEVEPVTDLVGQCASLGLMAFSRDLGVDTADAGTILLRRGAVSLINSHSRVGRRRLALAHELGHFVVADDYTIDWRVADQSGSDIESRLDRFARALLLPEVGLRDAWSRHESLGVRDRAVVAASEFRVDMSTLSRRLDELHMEPADVLKAIRQSKTTKADIIEMNLFVPADLDAVSLPVPFQKAVVRAVKDERISRERALELLWDTYSDDDLPESRIRREDELWKFVS